MRDPVALVPMTTSAASHASTNFSTSDIDTGQFRHYLNRMLITAKYSGICPVCSSSIAAGSKVEWARGEKARHAACATVPATSTATDCYGRPLAGARIAIERSTTRTKRSPGRRTGCSCGSREDRYGDLVPSERNCSHCEHDA